jgi:hypothetical protein
MVFPILLAMQPTGRAWIVEHLDAIAAMRLSDLPAPANCLQFKPVQSPPSWTERS